MKQEIWIPVSRYAQVVGVSRGKAYVDIMTGKVPKEDIKVETVSRQQYMIRLTGELANKYKKMFSL
jgi:hypothetical protein